MAKGSSRAAKIRGVEKRIVDIGEADPFVKCLFYGRNGSEKTRLGATAPNPIFIDINEKGTKSAKRLAPHAKVFPAQTWEDFVYAYWYLKSSDHDRETVIIDTVTGAQGLCMRQVLGEMEDRDPNRPPNMPDRQAWGKLAELMKPQILNYRNLDMHVIFIAQERKFENDETGEVQYVPDVSPGSRGTLMGAVDIIGRTYQAQTRKVVKKGGKKKEVRVWEPRMLVGPHEDYETKDRTGSLGRIMRNPTVPTIINAASTTNAEEE